MLNHGQSQRSKVSREINPDMPKLISLALIVAGIVLLVYGLNSSDSVSSSVSRAVNGTPTDKTIWLIALGVVGVIAGGCGIFTRRDP
jgi:hypothetical protein